MESTEVNKASIEADIIQTRPDFPSLLGALGNKGMQFIREGAHYAKSRLPIYASTGALAVAGILQEIVSPASAETLSTPLKPAKVMHDMTAAHFNFYSYSGGAVAGYMNITGSSLRAHHYIARGRCKAKYGVDLKNFTLKIDDRPNILVQTMCGKKHGHHIIHKYKRKDWNYIPEQQIPDWTGDLRKTGNKAAARDGIDNNMHGDTMHAKANNNIANIYYAKDPQNSGRQLKRLTLRKGKTSLKTWYS